MKEDWIDKISDKLNTYEEPVPEELWGLIEKGMAVNPRGENRSQVFPLWSRLLIASAAAILIGFMLIKPRTNLPEVITNMDSGKVVARKDILNTHENRASNAIGGKDTFPDEVELLSEAIAKVGGDLQENRPTLEMSTKEQGKESQPDPVKIYSPEVQQSAMSEKLDQDDGRDSTVVKRANIVDDGSKSTRDMRNSIKIQSASPKKISISLFANNLPGYSDTSIGYGRAVALSEVDLADREESLGTSAKKEVMFFNQNKELKQEVVHSLPISIGFTASYALSGRLSVESGLMYTYLSSKIIKGTENNWLETVQYQHLIGIPLTLKHRYYQTDKVDLYASLGCAIERSISMANNSKYMINHEVISKVKGMENSSYFIWSVRGALGVRYSVYKNLGIYLEPGVTYHFTHQGLPKSIYTDAPISFCLTLGLNLHL